MRIISEFPIVWRELPSTHVCIVFGRAAWRRIAPLPRMGVKCKFPILRRQFPSPVMWVVPSRRSWRCIRPVSNESVVLNFPSISGQLPCSPMRIVFRTCHVTSYPVLPASTKSTAARTEPVSPKKGASEVIYAVPSASTNHALARAVFEYYKTWSLLMNDVPPTGSFLNQTRRGSRR